MLTERGPQSSKVGWKTAADRRSAGFCAARHGSRSAGNGALNQLPGGVHGGALEKDGNSGFEEQWRKWALGNVVT